MQKIKMTGSLKIFHDGQYFIALFEKQDNDGYSVCKSIFPTEPSNAEIYEYILKHYDRLRFSKPQNQEFQQKQINNPKRRQRELSKAMKQVRMSTKAQEAIASQREQNKCDVKKINAKEKRAIAEEKYEKRKEKKKQKHKGR